MNTYVTATQKLSLVSNGCYHFLMCVWPQSVFRRLGESLGYHIFKTWEKPE